MIELDAVLLSLSLLDTFFQFNFLVSQLINPLLLCSFQIIGGLIKELIKELIFTHIHFQLI